MWQSLVPIDISSSNYGKAEWLTINIITLKMISGICIPFSFYLAYLIIPRTTWSRKKIIYISISICLIFLLSYLFSKEVLSYLLHFAHPIVVGTTIGILLRLAIDWFSKRKKLEQLQKENLQSNLALLKHQLNPHFLFNTLHNIDSLIYIDKSKASQSIEKLSDIMRYMLKDAKVDFVKLDDELSYLNNYIELERLRFKNQAFLDFTATEGDTKLKIAPMILLPFVENAFKHAVDSSTEKGIEISIIIKDKQMQFLCQNIYNPDEAEKDRCNGIGLSTVKQRLELIYANKYELDITTENNTYTVNLELNLHED